MLEKHFIASLEYVELNQDNYASFSNFYALLIQAIDAELDNVFKEYCGFNTSERKSITNYARSILQTTPEIRNHVISIQEYDIEIQPFSSWTEDQPSQSLEWWTAFTNLKHSRYSKMKQAKQENVLNILGALYLIEMLFLKRITDGTNELDVFDKSSNLFSLKGWTYKTIPLNQAFAVLGDMITDENSISNKKFDA